MLLIMSLQMFAGCPTDAPVDGTPPPMNGGGQPGGEMPPGGQPGGEGGAPPPGGENPAGATSGGPPSLSVEAGQGVKVSGSIDYAGKTTGSVRVDILSADGKILHIMTLEKLGAWELEVPKDLGEIKINAFIDTDGNGPSTYEPTGEVKVAVAQAAVTNANITLVDGTGSAPAGGSTAPTGGGAMPDPSTPDAMGGQAAPPGAAPGGGAPPSGAPPAGGEAPPADGKAGGKAGGKAEGKGG